MIQATLGAIAQLRTLGIKENKNEENISTEQNQESSNARLPTADGHQSWTPGHQPTSRQGAQETGTVGNRFGTVNGRKNAYAMAAGWRSCIRWDRILKFHYFEKRSQRTTDYLSDPNFCFYPIAGSGYITENLSLISVKTISIAVALG